MPFAKGPDCQEVKWRGGPGERLHSCPPGAEPPAAGLRLTGCTSATCTGPPWRECRGRAREPGEGPGRNPDAVQSDPLWARGPRVAAAWASGPRGCSPLRMTFSRTRIKLCHSRWYRCLLHEGARLVNSAGKRSHPEAPLAAIPALVGPRPGAPPPGRGWTAHEPT